MFLFAFLGFLDILVSILLFLSPAHVVSFRLTLGAALYLGLKGYLFRGDFFSVVDMVTGIYILISYLFAWPFLSYVLGAYLFLKGFYSMASTGIFTRNK